MSDDNEKIIYEPSETTHWRNLFDNKNTLLGAHNLNPGEELIAEIKEIKTNGEIKDKVGNIQSVSILMFTNAPDMVLNITNAKTISSLYGEYTEKWPGKSIQLYAAPIKAFGENTLCLRIRKAIPDTGEDVSEYLIKLQNASNIKELQDAYKAIPSHLKAVGSDSATKINAIKNEIKEGLKNA